MLWGALSHDFWLSLVGAFFCGLFTTTIWSFTMTMLQEAIDHEYYGRVVSINDMFFTATATMTSIVLGAMMEGGFGGAAALFALGALFVLMAFLYRLFSSTLVSKFQK